MIQTYDLIAASTCRELIAAGSVNHAVIEGADRGLVVVLHVGMQERVIGAARGGPRYFQSIDGAASVLKQYGISKFAVDVTNWVPKTLARKQAAE